MTHQEVSVLLGLIIAHLVAASSPGPDFMAVVKQSIQNGKKAGILTSAGISVGLLLHCAFSLTILSSLILYIPPFLTIMKIISALYLIYLAYGCFKPNEQAKSETKEEKKTMNPFVMGLLTNGTNPKVLVSMSAMFTAIAGQFKPIVLIGVSGYLALQTFAWFVFVTFLFCQNKPREIYLYHQKKIDITMGVILLFFAGYLLFSSIH